MVRTIRFFAGLIALLIASCAIAQPAPPKTVNLIVFPGGFNWPIWVAQEKGLFAKNGIEVRLTPTVSSVSRISRHSRSTRCVISNAIWPTTRFPVC